jgi:hypothetical protein
MREAGVRSRTVSDVAAGMIQFNEKAKQCQARAEPRSDCHSETPHSVIPALTMTDVIFKLNIFEAVPRRFSGNP